MGPRAAPNRISPLKGLGAVNADERRQGRCPAGFKLGWQPPCVTSYTDWCRRADRVPAARLACRLPPANPTLHFLFGFNAAAVGDLTMTSTLSRTSSTARSGDLSDRPSADRYSTMMFWPSTRPSSRRPCRNASRRCELELDEARRTAMRGTLPAGCASRASGAARRPPLRLVTNARREITGLPHRLAPALTAGRRALTSSPS